MFSATNFDLIIFWMYLQVRLVLNKLAFRV